MGLIRSDDIQYKLEEINSTIGKRVYVIITKSEGEADREYCPTLHLNTTLPRIP